jgi:microcystin-dependent protein
MLRRERDGTGGDDMTTAITPIDDDQPSIVLNQVVVESGFFPAHDGNGDAGGIPLGAIRTFANDVAAQGGTAGHEQPATGEILPIAQQTALFSLLGTQYGGNGFANFGLPNLAGTVMVGAGNGPSGQVFQGETYGQHSVTLTSANLPTAIGGGGQPITNDQPSLGVTYLINVGGSIGSGGSDSVDVAGMIVPFLGNFAPQGYMVAAGQLLSIVQNPLLFAQLGNIYGGNASQGTFALPNLQGSTVIGAGDPGVMPGPPLGQVTGSDTMSVTKPDLPPSLGFDVPIDNHQPSLALTYLICTSGLFFQAGDALSSNTPYLGEIIAFAGTHIPDGWTVAAGQTLSIEQNQALFVSIGTTYGGDGQTTFELPNLVGRDVVGSGTGAGLPGSSTTNYTDGMTFGSDNITLTPNQVPANQAPTITITAPSYSVAEGGTLQLLGTGISIADPGGGNGSEALTIKPSEGSFTFVSPSSNGTFVSLNSDGGITAFGSVAQLNAWLSQTNLVSAELGYVNADHQPGTETLQFTLNDNGNTGFPALSATASVVVDIVPCYCPGTLIRTARGQKRVEQLGIGDKVMTKSGVALPVKWIGRRSYSGRFVLGRKDILPVCIKAGALDDNVPQRDLWISPHHAMYFEDQAQGGVLIEARHLVNGVSIVQAERADKVEYVHVELDSHDVIVAEGALSETFLDDDSRGMFHNAHEYDGLYPDDVRQPARYCAPRREDGYEVEAVRQRLAQRAGLAAAADAPRISELRGMIDHVGKTSISGWAQNTDHPEAPVCLDIYADGILIGRTLANRYREDLEHAGLGSGCHGFAFTAPAGLTFALDAVEVRRSLDGAILSSVPGKTRTTGSRRMMPLRM